MSKKGINVLVVDDHGLFRDGVVNCLRTIPAVHQAFEAGSGSQALKILGERPIDLVLMDICMPELDGNTATHMISRRFPNVKIVALTNSDDEDAILSMHNAGVRGYLLKNVGRKDLETAIDHVMDGAFYYSKEISAKIMPRLLNTRSNEKQVMEQDLLSEREIEILRLICQQYSSAEIAARLGLSERTVEGHRKRILQRTGSKNVIGLYEYAVRKGILFK